MPLKYTEDEQEYYDLLELASYLCLQWRLARPPSKGGRISKASSCTRDLIRQHINAGKTPRRKERNYQPCWEKKWVVDGNIWTGACAVAGMDMVACWLKEQFGLEVLTYAARNLDYEPRGVDGVSLVIPRRYDESEKQITTHAFFYY
ncbi:hypothetical protein E8E15_003046 [Penicillium rubens]|nr:hypothetical protein E8E15_003046 [Penicillium rubens]